MKPLFKHILIGLVWLSIISCVSSDKPSEDRKPASISELSGYLEKNGFSRRTGPFRKAVGYINVLEKHPKQFRKISSITQSQKKNRSIMQSDTNNDGKIDIQFIKKNSINISKKIDRNFDGKVDWIETKNNNTKEIKIDKNHDGIFDLKRTFKFESDSFVTVKETHLDSKKLISYKFLSSSSDKTEGAICEGCEVEFTRAIRDRRAENFELPICREGQTPWEGSIPFPQCQDGSIDASFTEYREEPFDSEDKQSVPGYELEYYKIEDTVLVSSTCDEGEESLDHIGGPSVMALVSDTLNDYFDCMVNWKNGTNISQENLSSRQQSASEFLMGFVNATTDDNKPLKIHCESDQNSHTGGGRAIIDPKRHNHNHSIPGKDAEHSIVLNTAKLMNYNSKQMKKLIAHEITHLFDSTHGVGVDKATSCPSMCFGPGAEATNLSATEEASDLCLSNGSIDSSSSINLNPEPYSYLNNIFKVQKAEGSGDYRFLELGKQIASELGRRNSKKDLLPIQTLSPSKKEELALNFLRASGSTDKEAIETFRNFRTLDSPEAIMLQLIYTDTTLSKTKIKSFTKKLKNYSNGSIVFNIILKQIEEQATD